MKKFMSLATLLCVLAMSFGISVSAAAAELNWSSIENNAVNVGIDDNLVLEFSEVVDMDKMNLANIVVNGSRDMVKDSSLNDGKVDGFTYEEVDETLVIDFKTFEYGTRYTVEFVDIPFVNSTETYNGKLTFTTELPSTKATVLESVDTSKDKAFTFHIWWHGSNDSIYNADEKANVVMGGSGTVLNHTFTQNLQNATAFAVTARASDDTPGYGAISAYVCATENNDWPTAGANILMSGSINFSSKEYKTYYYFFPNKIPDGVTSIKFATEPGSTSKTAYIKNVSLVSIPNVSFSNEKLLEVDATKGRVFSGWNTANAGNSLYNESEEANQLEGSWGVMDSTIPNYKNAGFMRITLKQTNGEAGKVQVITTSTSCTECNAIGGDNVYSRTNDITVNAGPEYTTVEIPITHIAGEEDNARLWILAGYLVKSVEVIPLHYVQGDYFTGEFNVIKNYGAADEEVKTKAGLTAGNYTAVLNGINNMSGEEQKITLINALYDGGKLADIAVAQTKTLVKGESVSEPITAELKNVPDYREGLELKAIVLDKDLKPVKDAISIKDDKRVKVLIVGNSITYHRPAELGVDENKNPVLWDGAWGMAATREANDYAHRLIASAEAAGYNAEFMIGNALGFETLDVTTPNELPKYREFAPDIVVAALGANVENRTETFAPLYEQFIKDIGASKNILVSTLWCPTELWDKIESFSSANGWETVDCLTTSTPSGNGGGGLEGISFNDWSAMNYLGNNSVGWHPGNTGMKLYAEQIWNEQLNGAIAEVAATK